jgi:hypothetical protein
MNTTNGVRKKFTLIGCVIAVLLTMGCSSIAPSSVHNFPANDGMRTSDGTLVRQKYDSVKSSSPVPVVQSSEPERAAGVPPLDFEPGSAKPVNVIRSTYGTVQTSTGVVAIKAEEPAASPSEKRACAPSPTYTPSNKSAAQTAGELPLLVLQPQYLAAGLLALVVAAPVLGVIAIVKHAGCSTKPPETKARTYSKNAPGFLPGHTATQSVPVITV